MDPQARYEELSKYIWAIPGGYVLQQIWRGLPAGSLALTPTTIVQQHLHGTPTFEVAWSNVKEIRAESKRGERNIRIIPMRGEDVSVHSKVRQGYADKYALPPDYAYLSSPNATVLIRGKHLSVAPRNAYHVLRYYHEHPANRKELEDGNGFDRFGLGVDWALDTSSV